MNAGLLAGLVTSKKHRRVDDAAGQLRAGSNGQNDECRPMSAHNVSSHRLDVSTCETCEMTKNHACQVQITADHMFFSETSESRMQHRHTAVVQAVLSYGIQSYPVMNESASDTNKILPRFMLTL